MFIVPTSPPKTRLVLDRPCHNGATARKLVARGWSYRGALSKCSPLVWVRLVKCQEVRNAGASAPLATLGCTHSVEQTVSSEAVWTGKVITLPGDGA